MKTALKCENLILYDWFSFTTKKLSVPDVISLLGLDPEPFKTVTGARGYTERAYCDGISIHYGGREEIWCEMSGQGCRYFESMGHGAWDTLFDVCSGEGFHITRLDVAYDDHNDLLSIKKLQKDFLSLNFVSKMEFWSCDISSKGVSLYHGAPSSDVRIRIYDKAAERNRVEEGTWTRVELQLRNDYAMRFITHMYFDTVGQVFAGVIKNYLRYVKPNPTDSNKRRWPTAKYWEKFIGSAEKLSLYETPGLDYNLSKLQSYVVDQAGACAAAYADIVGEEHFLEEIRKKLRQSRNKKLELVTSLNKKILDAPAVPIGDQQIEKTSQ